MSKKVLIGGLAALLMFTTLGLVWSLNSLRVSRSANRQILLSFSSLRSSLRVSTEASMERNYTHIQSLTEKIEKAVEETGSTEDADTCLLALTDIKNTTSQTLNFLHAISNELEDIAQVDPATGELLNPGERELNYRYWMFSETGNDLANGGRGAGKAKDLKDELDAYIGWANNFLMNFDPSLTLYKELKFELIAQEPWDIEGTNETWEYISFHNTPVIADLTMMEKFKSEVTVVQYELLRAVEARIEKLTEKEDS